MTTTTCKKCQRLVYTTDVDAKGYCCFCVDPFVAVGTGKATKADAPKKRK